MRTFTVVPSFEGESAYFELPDIGFQGDHLSFAILFNLTELMEHWPDIVPSMIVTNPKAETFIAPYTSWNPADHIFTWSISSTETAYAGKILCQMKCVEAGDPETVVCMSQICQTQVYESLAAADNPPEAFQAWLDALTQLAAEISTDAGMVLAGVATNETNARTAQAAAQDAVAAKNLAVAAQTSAANDAATVAADKAAVALDRQRAAQSASAAETAKNLAVSAQSEIEDALDEMDGSLEAVQQAVTSAQNAAAGITDLMDDAQALQTAVSNAADTAVAAQQNAEAAATNAATQKNLAIAAQEATAAAKNDTLGYKQDAGASAAAAALSETAAGNAKTAAEAAQTAAEGARDAILGMTVSAEHVDPGQNPTASYSNGHMTLGIPEGEVPTIISEETVYAVGTSGTTAPTEGWSSVMPELVQGNFLWIRKTLTWDTGDTSVIDSVSYVGMDAPLQMIEDVDDRVDDVNQRLDTLVALTPSYNPNTRTLTIGY